MLGKLKIAPQHEQSHLEKVARSEREEILQARLGLELRKSPWSFWKRGQDRAH